MQLPARGTFSSASSRPLYPRLPLSFVRTRRSHIRFHTPFFTHLKGACRAAPLAPCQRGQGPVPPRAPYDRPRGQYGWRIRPSLCGACQPGWAARAGLSQRGLQQAAWRACTGLLLPETAPSMPREPLTSAGAMKGICGPLILSRHGIYRYISLLLPRIACTANLRAPFNLPVEDLKGLRRSRDVCEPSTPRTQCPAISRDQDPGATGALKQQINQLSLGNEVRTMFPSRVGLTSRNRIFHYGDKHPSHPEHAASSCVVMRLHRDSYAGTMYAV